MTSVPLVSTLATALQKKVETIDKADLDALIAPERKAVGYKSSYKAPDTVVNYYSFTGKSQNVRAFFLAQALWRMDTVGFSDEQISAWFHSCLDATNPGCVEAIYKTVNGYSANPVVIGQTQLSWMKGENPPPDPNAGAVWVLFPMIDYDAARDEKISLREMICFFATFLLTWGKRPTSDNISAFLANRIKAFKGRYAIEANTSGWMDSAELHPKLESYVALYGFVNVHHTIRKAIAQELISWALGEPSPDQDPICVAVRLWAGAGEGHIRVISELIRAYGFYLVQIPLLKNEVDSFIKAVKSDLNKTLPFREYNKAVYGDKYATVRSRDYPELLKIARELLRRADPRWEFYVKTAEESQWMDHFEELVIAANDTLPKRKEFVAK